MGGLKGAAAAPSLASALHLSLSSEHRELHHPGKMKAILCLKTKLGDVNRGCMAERQRRNRDSPLSSQAGKEPS